MGRNPKLILITSVAIAIWATYQIFVEQKYFQGGILLAYVGVVVWGTTGLLHRYTPRNDNTNFTRNDKQDNRNDNPSPQPSPTRGEGISFV